MIHETTDRRGEFIAGLRALADFLEATPSVPCSSDERILLPLHTNAAVEHLATTLGLNVDYDAEGNAALRLQFGPLTYHLYGYVDFDAHCARADEKRARTWAASRGLSILPAEGGAA